MKHAEAIEFSQKLVGESLKVPDGNVEYRLVAFEDGNRFPIQITTSSPFELADVGEQYEIRITGRTISGNITLKRTVMAYSGSILAMVTTMVLK